jgi:hypothetical protein
MRILMAAGVQPEPAAAIAADAIVTDSRGRLAGIGTAWPSLGPADAHGDWWQAWAFVAKVAKRHGFDVGNLAQIDSLVLEITLGLSVAGVPWEAAEKVAIDAIARYGPNSFAILISECGDDADDAAWMLAWHRVAFVADHHGWRVRLPV